MKGKEDGIQEDVENKVKNLFSSWTRVVQIFTSCFTFQDSNFIIRSLNCNKHLSTMFRAHLSIDELGSSLFIHLFNVRESNVVLDYIILTHFYIPTAR